MGIKGLWGVLTPFSEKKSLHEIRGETIAVDLSGWVCDSQNVTDYHIQPKLYLRNLFFRTIYLVMAEVRPIFVLEGDAPELKRDVMAARNAVQFRGAPPKADNSKKNPKVSRNRFWNVLKECESLLQCLGVSCVKASGEAEATCALLNAQGLVDAVVSQDSDCFAYGARKVYRNFSVSTAAGGGAMQGSIDCYDVDKMITRNGFGRNKMVALALLCGCDYGVGVCGSATGTVVSFLHTVQDSDVITRLHSWVNEPEKYEAQQRLVSAPGQCDKCGHLGRSHTKHGCSQCFTDRGCTDTGHKAKICEMKRELSLRSKALSSGVNFPETKVMSEFLSSPEEVRLDRRTLAPSLIKFVKLMRTKLDWSEKYSVEKFLPLLTKWHLSTDNINKTLTPHTIKKKRNPKGVPSYEVIWSNINGHYDGLIPDDQFEDDEDPKNVWTTIERQDLMSIFYPDLVRTYEESIKKPPKEKKAKGRKKKDPEEPKLDKPKRKYTKKKQIENHVKSISDSLNNINLSYNKENKANVSVKVNKLKRKIKNNKVKNQKTLESFVSKRRKSMKKLMESLRYSFNHISLSDSVHIDKLSVNKNNNTKKSDNKQLNLLDLSDDGDSEIDLSNLVENIVKKAPLTKTASVNNNLIKLIFNNKNMTKTRKSGFRKSILNDVHINCSTPNSISIRRKHVNNTVDMSNNVVNILNNVGNMSNNVLNMSHNMNIPNNVDHMSYNVFNMSNNAGNMSSNVVNTSNGPVSTSFFFDKLTEEMDAFEKSVQYKNDSDYDKTQNYSISISDLPSIIY